MDGRAGAGRDPSLYHGGAGVLLALMEVAAHDPSTARDAVVESAADGLARATENLEDSSLFFGLAGAAVALHAAGRDHAARSALTRVRDRFDGGRWNDRFELLLGNADIGWGARQEGDLDLAVLAVEPYLNTWDRTADGVSWAVRPGPSRSHHVAHGTLGIALALASVGRAADRDDLVELALRGASDVVGRNAAGPGGRV